MVFCKQDSCWVAKFNEFSNANIVFALLFTLLLHVDCNMGKLYGNLFKIYWLKAIK